MLAALANAVASQSCSPHPSQRAPSHFMLFGLGWRRGALQAVGSLPAALGNAGEMAMAVATVVHRLQDDGELGFALWESFWYRDSKRLGALLARTSISRLRYRTRERSVGSDAASLAGVQDNGRRRRWCHCEGTDVGGPPCRTPGPPPARGASHLLWVGPTHGQGKGVINPGQRSVFRRQQRRWQRDQIYGTRLSSDSGGGKNPTCRWVTSRADTAGDHQLPVDATQLIFDALRRLRRRRIDTAVRADQNPDSRQTQTEQHDGHQAEDEGIQEAHGGFCPPALATLATAMLRRRKTRARRANKGGTHDHRRRCAASADRSRDLLHG